MPQVTARIRDDQESWLKTNFCTKSAGAEFLMAWTIDTFFHTIPQTKQLFEENELKIILKSYKDIRLRAENTGTSYLLLRVKDTCEILYVREEQSVVYSNLESKIKNLNNIESTALMIWASAFWISRSDKDPVPMEGYISKISFKSEIIAEEPINSSELSHI